MFNHVTIVELYDIYYVMAIPFMYEGEHILEEYDTLQEAIERGEELEPHLAARYTKAYSAIRSTRLC